VVVADGWTIGNYLGHRQAVQKTGQLKRFLRSIDPQHPDPETEQLVRLFHPRTDCWPEHFEGREAEIVGKTPIGRVTVQVLAMNADDLLLFRVELLAEGVSLF
jgi:hypothetical protein